VTRYLAARLVLTVLQMWLVASVLFVFIHLLPGDPADVILGGSDLYSPSSDQLVTVRRQLGLDRPLAVQYAGYLGRLLRGDLGRSFISREPVVAIVGLHFGRTLQIVVPAIVWSSAAGLVMGVAAARRRRGWRDWTLTGMSVIGYSVPAFVTGNLLALVFAVKAKWLPSSGFIEFSSSPAAALAYMVLPVLVLGVERAAVIMRMTRTVVVEQWGMDYVRTARSKGLQERVVTYRHVVRNALIPLVAIIGLQVGFMLAGAIVVEAVFNWPGVGTLLLQSIQDRDYPVIQAAVLMVSITFVVVNFLTDLGYAYVNPQLRFG